MQILQSINLTKSTDADERHPDEVTFHLVECEGRYRVEERTYFNQRETVHLETVDCDTDADKAGTTYLDLIEIARTYMNFQ